MNQQYWGQKYRYASDGGGERTKTKEKWRNPLRNIWLNYEMQHKDYRYSRGRREGEWSRKFVQRNNSWELPKPGEGAGSTSKRS